MNQRVEYKIIESLKNVLKTQHILNEVSADGWRVVGFDQYQILLEREVKNNEDDKQGLLFD